MTDCYVGIDSGLTVTKAAVFDAAGRCLGESSVPSVHAMPGDGVVETDPQEQWRAAAAAVRAALDRAAVPPGSVAAAGVTAHGDCVYLVDAAGRPVRPAIPSLDFRGAQIAARWRRDGTAERMLGIIGEIPHPHHVHATLAWLADNEPQSLAATRWVLFAKDWLRLRLTGTVGTDLTDATAGFVEVRGDGYSAGALAACGLERLAGKLPPIGPSVAAAGAVTEEAAAVTGLPAGTPVACGVHDITAAALGSGLAGTCTALLVAGTYSVNAVLADRPAISERWLCRHWAVPGQWIVMSTSATSASNLAWAVEQLGLSAGAGRDRYAAVDREVAEVLDDDPRIVFHPFLFGTPACAQASAALLGLRSWHRRGHVYLAMLQGIAFSHRQHLETLARGRDISGVLLAGGAANSAVWSQLFADTLGLPVTVPEAAEAGTLGAALCAMVAAGRHATLGDAIAATARARREHVPGPARQERMQAAYERFTATADAAAEHLWPALGGES